MSRGRKALAPGEKKGPEFIGATPPDQALVEAEATKRVTALAKQLDYSGPLTPDAFEDNIYRGKHRMVEGTLEVGINLLLLKESCGHGHFRERLQAVGIHPRMASKFMGAALKFSKGTSPSLLTAAGTESKLLELLALDDGEIEALETDGAIGDITLDKIELMGMRELRQEIKKLHGRVEDQDGRIEKLTDDKEKAEQRADKAARVWRSRKPNEQEEELHKAARLACNNVLNALAAEGDGECGLLGALRAVAEHGRTQGQDASGFIGGLIADVLMAARRIREDDDVMGSVVNDLPFAHWINPQPVED